MQEGVADMESACQPRYIQMKTAVIYCGMSRWTIQKWVLEKGLRRHKVGRTVLFDVKDLDAFMQEYAE